MATELPTYTQYPIMSRGNYITNYGQTSLFGQSLKALLFTTNCSMFDKMGQRNSDMCLVFIDNCV